MPNSRDVRQKLASEGCEKCLRYQEVVYVRTDNSSRPTHVNEIVQVMVKDFISINVTVDE